MNPDNLSTSKLAKLLGVDSKVLFALMAEKDWLRRENDSWILTGQGEFHGGCYVQSERYGQYVVWPKTIVDHPMLAKYQDEQQLTATKLGAPSGLSGKRVNEILHELDWLERSSDGWQATELGRIHGAQQRSGKQGLYVVWPGELRHNRHLLRAMSALQFEPNAVLKSRTNHLCALDGHRLPSADYAVIDNWLYMAGLLHAFERPLAVQEDVISDFYLPDKNIYIEYWGDQSSAKSMLSKMEKKEVYQKYRFKLIELDKHELADIDTVLPQKLLQLGVTL
ncbi:hypothetical protein SIN8267_03544 [Sinobacterium norvegicum]|uniref:Glycerol kinase n=1 Tax=Sinobacterium norvegicum TaxID=1641715 RepID=A0ABM9AK45_9GAMM|nr:hypothetical protein [Sinobacterium norvegicum]CAH0993395.1 hypothetical protein SIN8267_03544 [Sinobacterium norvegicum]